MVFVQDELYEYCYRVRRTILEVLSEFRHVQVPKDYIFDMFPPLRPREFSIASSFKVRESCIFIIFSSDT
jgi:sulfite reductase alpha subunit-like flavoprotein